MLAEASTAQTFNFQGRLTEVRTPEVTTRLRRQVGRLTLGLTVADRSEFASGNFQSGTFRISATGTVTVTHGITVKICT